MTFICEGCRRLTEVAEENERLCSLVQVFKAEIEQLHKDVARWKTEYEYERHNHHAVIDRHNEIMDEIGDVTCLNDRTKLQKRLEIIREQETEIAKLRAESEEMRIQFGAIAIGANHLANVLIQKLGPDFADRFPFTMDARESALRLQGRPDIYDVWCTWAVIMRTRDMMAKPQ